MNETKRIRESLDKIDGWILLQETRGVNLIRSRLIQEEVNHIELEIARLRLDNYHDWNGEQ